MWKQLGSRRPGQAVALVLTVPKLARTRASSWDHRERVGSSHGVSSFTLGIGSGCVWAGGGSTLLLPGQGLGFQRPQLWGQVSPRLCCRALGSCPPLGFRDWY